MNEKKLQSIHEHMTKELENAGGRIDKILYCTSTINTHPDRKPNPGLAFMAKSHFTTIDFSKSVMIGNKPSDMLFGKNAGMYSIFLATTNPEVTFPHPDIDLRFDTLADFAKAL